MKGLQNLLTILWLQNSLCTIDISIPEYQYLSHSLTPEECRRLYASLHFTTFDLPAALPAAEKNVPLDVPCLKLLAKWDRGTKNWQGYNQGHVDVARRLQQLGRNDLAEWLSKTVSQKLVKEVDEALNEKFCNKTKMSKKIQYEDKENATNDWTTWDSVMWAILAGLVISTVIIFGRIIMIYCQKRKTKKAKEEEIIELLNYGSVDSDQETIYECVVGNRYNERCNDK